MMRSSAELGVGVLDKAVSITSRVSALSRWMSSRATAGVEAALRCSMVSVSLGP